MAESKFLNLQNDVCEKPDEEPKSDRICATCVPNPSYIAPDWWEQTEPWLNEATCEYSVAVTINQDGRSFRLSDIRKANDTVAEILSGVESDQLKAKDSIILSNPRGTEAGVFDMIKKSFKRPGIRKLLRHYGKLEDDTLICAAIDIETKQTHLSRLAQFAFLVGGTAAVSTAMATAGPAAILTFGAAAGTSVLYDIFGSKIVRDDLCRGVQSEIDLGEIISEVVNSMVIDVGLIFGATQSAACANLDHLDFTDFITVRNQLASFSSSQEYKTFGIEEQILDRFCEIKNLNAIELYARVSDYHFYGTADNVMSVLVTIPAHIFDQIPPAPTFDEVDINIDSVQFTVSEFTTFISQITATFRAFSKFQAAFYQNESGKMVQIIGTEENPVEVPFYIKTYIDKFEKFESILSLFLQDKGYGYPGGDIFSQARGFFSVPNDVIEIEMNFDKDDESRPFRLADKLRIKPKSCDWIELDLPAQPSDDMPSLSEDIRTYAYNNQTLMAYIANFKSLKDQVNARETPPWLDFIVENTYPQISVNYGTSNMFSDKTAVNCLADRINQIDDAILNQSLDFFDSFAYTMNKNNCILMKNLYNDKQVIFDGKKETEKIKKAKERQKQKKLKKEDKIEKELKDQNKNSSGGKSADKDLKKVLGQLNPCNWKAVTLKSISCLLSGMTVEDGYRTILKTTIGSLSSQGLESVIQGLPIDKQQKIKEQVEKSFKDMPAPWETGWETGDLGEAVDRTVMDKIGEQKLNLKEIDQTYEDLQKEVEIKTKRLEEIQGHGYIELETIKRIQQVPNDAAVANEYQHKINMLTGQPFDPRLIYERDPNFMTQFGPDFGSIEELKDTKNMFEEQLLDTLNQINTLSFLLEQQKLIIQQDREVHGYPCKDTISGVEYDTWCYEDSLQEDAGRRGEPRLYELRDEIKDIKEIYEETILPEVEKAQKVYDEAVLVLDILKKEYANLLGNIIRGGYTPNEDGTGFSPDLNLVEGAVKKEVEQEIQDINNRLAEIKNILENEEVKIREALQKDPNIAMWEALTDEEKQTIIDREKDKTTLVSLNEKDKIKQGTLGRALGDVQKAVFAAYTDAIMESADVRELMSAVNKLPGSKIIGSFIASFDCPKESLIYPPINDFLKTLTSDPCGPGKTRFALPEIKRFPQRWNPFAGIPDAFMFALRKSFSSILSSLLLKKASVLEAAACRAIEAGKDLGFGLIDTAGGDSSMSEAVGSIGLAGIIDDLVCKETSQEEQDQAAMNLFNSVGVPQQSPATARELLNTMSVLGSEDDYKRAMLADSDDQDRNFLKNLARTVTAVHPEYAPFIGSPESMGAFLQSCGNFLTEEQRTAILDETAPTGFFPLESSICLSKAEAQQFDDELAEFYSGYVGPEVAKEFVDKQRQRAKSDLADLVDALVKGPEGIFQDAINQALAQPDPDCNHSIVKRPEAVKNVIDGVVANIFVPLNKSFIDDTMEENFFESAFGLDSTGILLTILSDVVGYNLAMHNRIRNNLIFQALAWIGLFDANAPYPDTVGLYMRDYMLNDLSRDDAKYKNSSVNWHFSDKQKDDNGKFIGFESKQKIEDVFLTLDENGDLYHHDTFDYMFYQKTPDYTISTDSNTPIRIERSITEEIRDELDKYRPEKSELTYDKGDASTTDQPANTFSNLVLTNILTESWSRLPSSVRGSINLDFSTTSLNKINALLFDQFKSSIIKDENGGIPQGFKHGGNAGVITLDDLTYVNPEPEATSYTYEEGDRVLGRSLTNNPRVKFLNPEKYGGSYEVPQIYIEPEEATGWMKMTQMIVPTISGCDPVKTNYLKLDELEKLISEREQVIEKKEELSQSPDCFVEVPFDKISAPATLAALEATVLATIRVYLAEFSILSMPILSAILLGEENYDELVPEFIVHKMREGMTKEGGFFVSTYEKYTYWLLFLEQVVQTYDRKVKLGEMKLDIQTQQILEDLKQTQLDYDQPTFNTINLIRFGEKDEDATLDFGLEPKVVYVTPVSDLEDFIQQMTPTFGKTGAEMMAGSWIIGSNSPNWLNQLNDEIREKQGDAVPFYIGGINAIFMTVSMARLSCKVIAILRNEQKCITLLNRLVLNQVKHYGEIMQKELSPRPLAFDAFKFLIGASKTTLGKTCRAGLYDIEVPVGDDNNPRELSAAEYGSINDCSPDGYEHPLTPWFSSIEFPENDSDSNLLDSAYSDEALKLIKLKRNGGFFLERYIKIVDKPTNPLGLILADQQDIPDFLVNRPKKLKNIVNINEFKSYLSQNQSSIDPEANISDYFGDATISSEEQQSEKYKGSIGIKFGVRICFIPSKDAAKEITNINDFEQEERTLIKDIAQDEKSYILNPVDNRFSNDLDFTKYVFPMVSYEKDISDIKVIDLIETNENLNQDLKCYIDKLVETRKFDLIFDKLLNIRKIPSYLACYSYANFYPSLGLGNNERRDADLSWLLEFIGADNAPTQPTTDERGDVFNDSKASARKIFTSVYKRNDYDPPDEDSSFDLSAIVQKLLAQTYSSLNLDSAIPWWYKKRIINNKSNPKDKNGNDCKNQFRKLFDSDS